MFYEMNRSVASSWVCRLRAGALLLAAAGPICGFPGPGLGAEVRATRAYDFVHTVGVNAHFRTGAPYNGNFETIKQLVGELGVRYIRQRLARDRVRLEEYKELNRLYGVKLLNVMNNISSLTGRVSLQGMQDDLIFARDHLGSTYLLGFENLNEYSRTKYQISNVDWHEEARSAAQLLYRLIKGDETLKTLPLLSPSIWKRIHDDYIELGDLSSVIDYGVLHYYTPNREPSAHMDKFIKDAQIVSGGGPLWVTETGYPKSVSGRTAAKYIPRSLMLFAQDPRVSKTFIFALINSNYGLVRTDLTKTPAFYAVRNLLRLLDEPDPSYAPGFLNYSISANTSDVRQVLLQKKDETFYLVLWREARSHNASTHEDINPSPASVRLSFNQPIGTVRTYLPSSIDEPPDDGLTPKAVFSSPTAISVDVPDHLLVVEIEPNLAGTQPRTLTLTPTDDAYLQGSTRHNNKFLKVEQGNRVSYLKFDLSSVTGTITDATLKLAQDNSIDASGNGRINVHLGTTNDWSELNLSISTAPGQGIRLGSLNTTYNNMNTYSFPLTGLTGGTTRSFVVSQSSGKDAWFSSKEGWKAPVLELTILPSR